MCAWAMCDFSQGQHILPFTTRTPILKAPWQWPGDHPPVGPKDSVVGAVLIHQSLLQHAWRMPLVEQGQVKCRKLRLTKVVWYPTLCDPMDKSPSSPCINIGKPSFKKINQSKISSIIFSHISIDYFASSLQVCIYFKDYAGDPDH